MGQRNTATAAASLEEPKKED